MIIIDTNQMHSITETPEGLAVSQKLTKAIQRYNKYLSDNKIIQSEYYVFDKTATKQQILKTLKANK